MNKNPHAVALGRLNRGVKKTVTDSFLKSCLCKINAINKKRREKNIEKKLAKTVSR